MSCHRGGLLLDRGGRATLAAASLGLRAASAAGAPAAALPCAAFVPLQLPTTSGLLLRLQPSSGYRASRWQANSRQQQLHWRRACAPVDVAAVAVTEQQQQQQPQAPGSHANGVGLAKAGGASTLAVTQAPTDNSVFFRFIVPEYVTRFGESLAVVGGLPELGDWDLKAAPRMTWHEGHKWVFEVRLPRANFEFKVVALLDQEVRWEQGVNRVVQAEEAQGVDLPVELVINLMCTFGATETTGVELVLSRQNMQESYELASATLELLRKRRARLQKSLRRAAQAADVSRASPEPHKRKLEVTKLDAALSSQARSVEELGQLVQQARLSEDGRELVLRLLDGKVQIPKPLHSLARKPHAPSEQQLALSGGGGADAKQQQPGARHTHSHAHQQQHHHHQNGSSSSAAAASTPEAAAAAAAAAAASTGGHGSSNGNGVAGLQAQVEVAQEAQQPQQQVGVKAARYLSQQPGDAAAAVAAAAFATLNSTASSNPATSTHSSLNNNNNNNKNNNNNSAKAAGSSVNTSTAAQANPAAAAADAAGVAAPAPALVAAADGGRPAGPPSVALAAPAAAPATGIPSPATAADDAEDEEVDLAALPPPEEQSGGALFFSATLLAAVRLPHHWRSSSSSPSPPPSSVSAPSSSSSSSAAAAATATSSATVGGTSTGSNGRRHGGNSNGDGNGSGGLLGGAVSGGVGGVGSGVRGGAGAAAAAEMVQRLADLSSGMTRTLERFARTSDAQQPMAAWKEVEAQLQEAQALQERLMAAHGGLGASQQEELQQLQQLVRTATEKLARRRSVTVTSSSSSSAGGRGSNGNGTSRNSNGGNGKASNGDKGALSSVVGAQQALKVQQQVPASK